MEDSDSGDRAIIVTEEREGQVGERVVEHAAVDRTTYSKLAVKTREA